MWPFSTIKNLRLELERAERANADLRNMLNASRARIDSDREALDVLYLELKGAMVRDPNTGRLKKWGT